MLKVGWLRQLQLFLLCLLAFTIPFSFIYSSAVIFLLSAAWLLRVDIKQLFGSIKEKKALWPWLLYFLLFALSYFYSSNKSQSLFDLQSKLSLLLFPLIIGAGIPIDKKLTERIFVFFISGITLAAVVSISNAVRVYTQTGDTSIFFYHNLVSAIPDMNAVYMAWYTLLSISALLFFPWETCFTGMYRSLRVILGVLHTIFFILLSSKMLIVLFFIIVVPYYLKKNFQHAHIARWKILLLVTAFTGLFIALITTENPVRKRYEEIVISHDLNKAWLDDYSDVDASKLSNLTIRVMAWRMGIENIIENNLWLTGSGNGDAQDLQNRKMEHYNIRSWNKTFDETLGLFNVNLHNMFLQSLLMIGIPGLALFIIIMFMPFFYIRKIKYQPVFLLFHVSAIAYMMQEAALQTQAGIVYHSFFTQVFWNIYYSYADMKNKAANTTFSEKFSGNLQPN